MTSKVINTLNVKEENVLKITIKPIANIKKLLTKFFRLNKNRKKSENVWKS